MALSTDVEKVHKELEQCWTQRMADFERRLTAASSPSNPTLLKLQDEFQSFKDLVLKMFKLLGQQVQENARVIDVIDMRSRQKVLLFTGLHEDAKTTVEQSVLNILHNNMGLIDVSSSSLKRCYRLGVKSNNSIRPVLVHFRDHHIKAEVWSRKAKLKGSTVSVTEFLTKTRQLVHKRARRHFGMRNVWTLDGTIHIKLPGGTRVKISTEEQLDSLIAKHPNEVQPSESLGVSNDGGLRRNPNSNKQHEDSQRKQVVPGSQSEFSRPKRVAVKK